MQRSHAHIADGGVQELYGVKLSDATSVAEIVVRVKAKVGLVKPGEWVTGSGWDEGKLSEPQMFLEKRIGSLEAGKQADIAVWDRDMYAIPTSEIKELKCVMTLIDGEVVYAAELPGATR